MNIISENTLYRYIFYPETLSDEEILLISNNSERYKEDLDHLEAIKSNLKNELSDIILDKIHEKINRASAKEGITLNLVNPIDEEGKCILAADSVSSEAKQNTCSYTDESNNYLIKIINNDDVNKIYLFTKGKTKEDEYTLTLFPSKEVFYVNTDDLPLLISPQQIIKSILLKTKY